MSDYIKREDAVKAFIGYSQSAIEGLAYKILLSTIPNADVEEVVHCKDCKYWQYSEYDYCKATKARGFGADDYCSYGERKE